MLTTTEFRSHWIDSAGRCYAQHHPYHGGLHPVINLDEVRAWVAIATSEAMRRIGFPGGEYDAAVFHMRRVIERGATTDDHLAAETGRQLTDDVPRYAQQFGADWRTPFVEMRERWPLPPLGGVAEIRNLTPHAVVVHEITLAPSGVIARATEELTDAGPIRLSIPDPAGAPADRITFDVPTSTTEYTGLVDLPAPEPGVYLIVSMVVMQVAADRGRWTGDLLVPGQQVRDSAGRIIGCRSLCRCAPEIEPTPGWEQRAEDRARREGVLRYFTDMEVGKSHRSLPSGAVVTKFDRATGTVEYEVP